MNLGKNKGWYCIPTSFQTRGAIKELHRAKHNTTEACREGQVEEVYIKRKCGHNVLYVVIFWTHCLVLLFQLLNMPSNIWNFALQPLIEIANFFFF